MGERHRPLSPCLITVLVTVTHLLLFRLCELRLIRQTHPPYQQVTAALSKPYPTKPNPEGHWILALANIRRARMRGEFVEHIPLTAAGIAVGFGR